MKEKPILFSGPMVNAILDGRKTQTRRIIKAKNMVIKGTDGIWYDADCINPGVPLMCPYGQPGDRLWVRETWNACPVYEVDDCIFEADSPYPKIPKEKPSNACVEFAADSHSDGPFRPSIFMPRWASRITLEITDVRVERLQDITEDDAMAEGLERVALDGLMEMTPLGMRPEIGWMNYSAGGGFNKAARSFATLWQSINGKDSWEQNPWVWVVSFRKLPAKGDS